VALSAIAEYRIVCWSVLMSHADQLIEITTELALDAKDEVADLQRKLSAVETAKIEIEARLRTANHALGRLSSFVSIRGSDLQPRCWINNEVIASLRPAGVPISTHAHRYTAQASIVRTGHLPKPQRSVRSR
jgi:hypothetical protein